jgi:hypothetical protein
LRAIGRSSHLETFCPGPVAGTRPEPREDAELGNGPPKRVKPTTEGDDLGIVRPLLLGVFAFGCAGTATELFLIGHTEELTQWIPLIAIGLGLAATGLLGFRPSRGAVQLYRVLMGLFIGAGVLGIALHYKGNAEFELEMRSTMAGLELVWNSLTGATPALAPGSLVPLGLVGIIATIRHPATAGRGPPGGLRSEKREEGGEEI